MSFADLALAPYQPGVDGPFAREEAAHLVRRAGFGMPAAELDDLAREGPGAAVERVFQKDEGRAARQVLDQAPAVAEWNDPGALQGLWLLRMRETRAQAVEKLALFWHGHFATSFAKVQSAPLMWRQYQTLRELGGGSFRELLGAVARDPAMLVWLDGNANDALHPNENFARELLELFTLGVGRYDEHDVREAARAFTGWHVRDGAFRWNERAHDAGAKEVLGRRGCLGGEDVLDACVAQEAAPRFLAEKLLRFYVHPAPERAWVEELAELLRAEDLVLEPVLRRLFASRLFFSPAVRRALVKSPVEYGIGALRTLEARLGATKVAGFLQGMGQELFAPPGVQGWEGHTAWLNTSAAVARQRFATELVFRGSASLEEALGDLTGERDARVFVRDLALRVHHAPLSPRSARSLEDFVRAQGGARSVPDAVHLLLSFPEYHLN